MSNRPPYELFKVTAKRCELISPNFKRLTIDCSHIPEIRPALPAQWLKVFVPQDGAERSVGRAYTVRRYDPITHEVDLDFYLHGDTGPIGSWAARAQVGQQFEVSGLHPRSGFRLAGKQDVYTLFGDETALPAIASIIESLPGTACARAFVSLGNTEDAFPICSSPPLALAWLERRENQPMVLGEAAERSDWPVQTARYWIAGESGEVKAVRTSLLKAGVDPGSIEAAGYWKRGQADHRDD